MTHQKEICRTNIWLLGITLISVLVIIKTLSPQMTSSPSSSEADPSPLLPDATSSSSSSASASSRQPPSSLSSSSSLSVSLLRLLHQYYYIVIIIKLLISSLPSSPPPLGQEADQFQEMTVHYMERQRWHGRWSGPLTGWKVSGLIAGPSRPMCVLEPDSQMCVRWVERDL